MKKYGKKKYRKAVVRAYAKINLSLDVLGKRPDGYHEVDMVMQAVELYDRVTVEWADDAGAGGAENRGGRIAVTTNLPYLPINRDNIAYKAAELMAKEFKPEEPLEIRVHLEKHIPVAAGLAGGSANGAAVLRGLAKLWGLNLPLAELCRLGESLGADVPFCLWAQEGLACARATGLGTELSPLPPLDCLVLLSKPPISVSTAKVYGGLRLEGIGADQRPDTEALMQGLRAAAREDRPRGQEADGGIRQVAANMKNLLETVTLKEFPRVLETKKAMEDAARTAREEGTEGALAVMMSGSGPTIFGLYRDHEAAKEAYRIMKKMNKETYLRRTWLG